uniref:Myocilin opposite strand n=1 Tax=Moschus moschiferus TaxID=68415 RepID=A0A8C6DSI2_MOSMO
MAGKGSTGYSINLPYRDLASEVMRRRIAMSRREERFTKQSDDAGEIPSDVESRQALPSAASPKVPPAPPPSPAEDFLST